MYPLFRNHTQCSNPNWNINQCKNQIREREKAISIHISTQSIRILLTDELLVGNFFLKSKFWFDHVPLLLFGIARWRRNQIYQSENSDSGAKIKSTKKGSGIKISITKQKVGCALPNWKTQYEKKRRIRNSNFPEELRSITISRSSIALQHSTM